MPISEKILNKINALNETKEVKNLMLAILKEEDKGNHRFKESYNRMVSEYLNKRDGDSYD